MPLAGSEQGLRPIRSRVREQRSALLVYAWSNSQLIGSPVAAFVAERARVAVLNCGRLHGLMGGSLLSEGELTQVR